MKIIFLTLAYPKTEKGRTLYSDLFDEIASRENEVIVFCPDESRWSGKPLESRRGLVRVVSVPTGRITKTRILCKAINMLILSNRYIKAVKLYSSESIDLLVYSTPPITFVHVIRTIRLQNDCTTYLLLKDIFPQNAVDIGMIKKDSLIHKYFQRKEKELYALSDWIGCMSPANVKYLSAHNPEIDINRIHVNPNSIRPTPVSSFQHYEDTVLDQWRIPRNSLKLIYGGNLGKPQGVSFLLEILEKLDGKSGIHTVIVGDGTEYSIVEKFIKKKALKNVTLIPTFQNDKYLSLLSAMDIGLIFLDSRFTIPNFPSRLLDYLNMGLPVIAVTDSATDIGPILEEHGAGLYCRSDDAKAFLECVDVARNKEWRYSAGRAARDLLERNYTSVISANILLNSRK